MSTPALRRPVVVETRHELAAALADRDRVALVPTMGALHAGHAQLVTTARHSVTPDDAVVVSIFVNPLQFGPGEDLDRYPRTFDVDLEVCARHGADLVFAPAVEEVYPGGDPQVTVEPGPLALELEGASRPGHFRGVLTVVAKLFGLVRPDLAVFGQKDYQQLVLVRRMVEDLCMGVDIVGAETVREPNGLALSSRNEYLSHDERMVAAVLSAALRAGATAGPQGEDAVLTAAHAVLASQFGVQLDYLALRGPDLQAAPEAGEARLLVAARVGTTRLIDNVAVHLGPEAESGPGSAAGGER